MRWKSRVHTCINTVYFRAVEKKSLLLTLGRQDRYLLMTVVNFSHTHENHKETRGYDSPRMQLCILSKQQSQLTCFLTKLFFWISGFPKNLVPLLLIQNQRRLNDATLGDRFLSSFTLKVIFEFQRYTLAGNFTFFSVECHCHN